ncbi:GntR family transcriptional regulator [Adhaeretor mobilis]|uniref:Putative HTH-type transcriptional regulator YurK n=1 Tax=Adhaeretor mobilis TaxID=1930276 RepID=A0A517MW52_9BACT|nr:GntR family transcriptional regulator [Adhaeretor mobilis]QDS99098.1 putative HTH-type transcriptional regulator YurK [Adhaeretor mobilis]
MISAGIENSNLKQLATALEHDIRRRGLRAGDRYLTASEACKQFNASEMSVHRAMQLLAEEGYLVRQRGAGTFVGAKYEVPVDQSCPLKIVHVVMSMDCQRIATLSAELLVQQLGLAMPDVSVDIHYIPEYDSLRHLERIVSGIPEANRPKEGVILIRSSRSMQLLIEESGLPAVVFGSIHPGVTKLSSIDMNQFEVGRLMARHALDAGRTRLILFMRDDWREGDNAVFSGVMQELAADGIGPDAFNLYCIPPESDYIAEKVRMVLSRECEPFALICRTHTYADAAEKVIYEMKKKDSVLLISGGGRRLIGTRYPYVTPEICIEDQVQILGRMLMGHASQAESGVKNQIVPAQFVCP